MTDIAPADLDTALAQVGALTSQVNKMAADQAVERITATFADETPTAVDKPDEVDEDDPLASLSALYGRRQEATAKANLAALVASAKSGDDEPEPKEVDEPEDGFVDG